MRLIGLTGGIATGKTTVATMLAARGAALVDADRLAREVVEPGTAGLAEIRTKFGPAVLAPDGSLDRAAMAELVFGDEESRRALEEITHPRISELMLARIAEALAGPAPLVVADIPLLFENRRQAMFEGTMLVYAPAEAQLARLRDRDGLDEAAARERLAAQLPIEHKRAMATWVIDNSTTVENTEVALAAWWRDVLGASHPQGGVRG